MNRPSIISWLCFAVVIMLMTTLAPAQEKTFLPQLPPAKGEACVEPTDVMRREHMNFILHQRDLTVHKGVRTEKHRFTNCINCHVQKNTEGEFPRHTSNEHFCTSCHTFSAVSIDCFQCHADRPAEAFQQQTTHPQGQKNKMHALLQEIKQ